MIEWSTVIYEPSINKCQLSLLNIQIEQILEIFTRTNCDYLEILHINISSAVSWSLAQNNEKFLNPGFNQLTELDLFLCFGDTRPIKICFRIKFDIVALENCPRRARISIYS